MATKISAAKIATDSGADMVIANGDDIQTISRIMQGENIGTLFKAHKDEQFKLMDYLKTEQYSD